MRAEYGFFGGLLRAHRAAVGGQSCLHTFGAGVRVAGSQRSVREEWEGVAAVKRIYGYLQL